MNRYFLLSVTLLICVNVFPQQLQLPQQTDRWQIESLNSIRWNIDKQLPHKDHIEMSGEKVSLWLQYEVDSTKQLHLKRTVVFPTFRVKPNDTHSSFMQEITDEELPTFFINQKPLTAALINGQRRKPLPQSVNYIRLNGEWIANISIGDNKGIELKRVLFPSAEQPMAIEQCTFINHTMEAVQFDMPYLQKEIRLDTSRAFKTPFSLVIRSVNDGAKTIAPGDSVTYAFTYQANADLQHAVNASIEQEESGRMQRIMQIQNALQLITPDTVLNTAFEFAKRRAAESIYKTKAGYMHGPGGLSYYAAIWANDQAEYVNPFFAWLGDGIGVKSAMNAYRLFAGYMNPDYQPIPSSIIAEGDGYWNGAGDRGDQAMIAYGASRFALTYGNKDSAAALWPLIEWCLEYCKRKINSEGVVASQSDELEGRFPSGDANLCTSSLYYDALNSAAKLAALLGKPTAQVKAYQAEAKALELAIEKYFGANVQGFNTYQYYKGNDKLRSWICIPLTVGIFTRKEGTVNALLSPQLFTSDGLLTQSGDNTFWDRSSLYALRGLFAANETETALPFLRFYSQRRLLGEHVPYPVEAYPEGGQRHLAAESGLYCRVYIEGLFGMRPTGFRSFDCSPHLPKNWDKMELKNIRAMGNSFDLKVERINSGRVSITISGASVKTLVFTAAANETVKVDLSKQ
ncbi:MAG TPA: hypothetical protein PKM63_02360 [Panacibacter sp.]|nr:hypothetical protein [Panacibacter sp.]